MKEDMKNIIKYILLIGTAFLFSMCTSKEIWEDSMTGDETFVNLDFAHCDFDDVEISTKATLDIRQESRVINMFVYLFVDGQRIYSHFFDQHNRVDSRNEAITSDSNCWYANTTDAGNTTGTIRIKAPQATGATLYIVANLDEDMMNLSSERLNTIQTIDELESLTVDQMQFTTSRNGYFPMVSKVSGVTVGETSITAGKAYLERLDSKVTVNIKLADSPELKAFIPEVCRIINIPAGCKLSGLQTADHEDAGYFDSELIFEDQTTNSLGNIVASSCSFYMLENRESGNRKNDISSYHERDKRMKNADGSYAEGEELWLNAPENATYLEIHGELQMEINSSMTGMQELIGDVIYYIHLGDFGNNLNDYDIRRNTHYTYDITIGGVNNIRVEVETEVENQSGATGHIYSATESHHTFDAHYGQKVFAFKAEEVDTENMTFYVKTPFGREGTPELPGGGYDVSDLDYKWVSFLVNEIDGDTYSLNNRTYPGDNNEMLIAQNKPERLMNIAELLEFVREEKEKYLEYKANGFAGENPSRFLKNADGDYCIYVTTFVNEFYYDSHPTENISISWKDFVNQPNRLMHILCSTYTSNDGASSITGSIITIRQRSIQTPYNINKAGLSSAFGNESVDETRDDNLSFYENDDIYMNVDFGNSSLDNGLYNTACLWNMFQSGSLKATRERWDTYLDYNVPDRGNGELNHFMKDGMECMRYSIMSRNRDNNGNGYIDPEEVRWYIAPLKQLYTLYVGDLGINSEAQLYPSSLASLPDQMNAYGQWQWRNHVVCSNKTTITNSGQYVSRNFPDMLWAEEGVSISGYGREWEKAAPKSIRCIRNLGLPDATEDNIDDMSANVPEPMISVKSFETGVYRFDLSNTNDKSIRFYTTHELIPSDEYGESSRVYYGFETDDEFISYTAGYANLRNQLEEGNSPCPEGYRVPNVREAALMSLFCPSSWWNGNTIMSCSYYSHGDYGSGYDGGTVTWFFQSNYVTISSSSSALRCVKDIQPAGL